MKNEINPALILLRQKAEEILKRRDTLTSLSDPQSKISTPNPADTNISLSEADVLNLIYELDVHQLELEMQNEELMQDKELREADLQKYNELYDFAPLGYYTLSREGEIFAVNHAGAQLLERNRSDLKNSRLGFYISEDTKPIFNSFLDKLFRDKTKESCEVILKIHDELPIYVQITGTVSVNTEQCFLIVVDITERKKAAEELSHQKLFFEQMIMQSSVSTQIFDTEGWCERINPKFSEIFGIEPRYIEGKKYNICEDEFVMQGEVSSLLKGVFKEGRHIEWEMLFDVGMTGSSPEIKLKEGKKIWYNNWAYPIFDMNGKVEHVVIQHRDITEVKNAANELLIAKEHAEESDRLKSAFLANMSHEIRTPMNGILGFAGLLKEPKLTGEEQKEYIDIIEKSGIRMLKIINDIIAISKVEAGQMKILISETNINEQIDYIYTFFKPEAEQKGLRLFVKSPFAHQETFIKTDKEKVYAILTNLVKNAIKYTDSGKIEFGYTITKAQHDLSLSPQNQHAAALQFFIKDTGIGIPKDRLESVFDRFVQVDIGDKRAFQGAGLGLSISKAYVEMLGGKIWVESEEGIGSTFYFTVPCDYEEREADVVKPIVLDEGAAPRIKDLSILIAEDDEPSEMLISLAVKPFSREVFKVKNGISAVELCRMHPDIDLVLMDIQMPEMNGYEATRQIRKFNTNVVIIAETAYALADDRELAIAAGCNDYIAKPFGKILLSALISKYFKAKGN
jgi:PAS domain S-box-containing protein